ncbi:putative manganese transporter [Pseudoalteromonas mariniglutinosa]|uniref:putative manganese transporter n=1 Tax=Pseudoalteromonas mariniglutinosa TaxID=206042 RepID=UPI00384D6D4F
MLEIPTDSQVNTYTTRQFISNNKRLLLPLCLIIALFTPATRELTLRALSDAFFQVSVFVAATLFIYYYLVDRVPHLQLSYLRDKSPTLEVLFSAFLGVLPGCGGAIIVVTQFTKKQASFGSVVAVLTATMGDAAFLLLATKPITGLIIMALGLVIGIASGVLVNYFHRLDYLHPAITCQQVSTIQCQPIAVKLSKPIWMLMLIPSLVVAFVVALNIDLKQFGNGFAISVTTFGALMALFIVTVWSLSCKGATYKQITSEEVPCDPPSKITKVLVDTHFVTAWVVASFVLFEVIITVFGLDLGKWFSQYAHFTPLVAVLIGLLPGCGPQIIVTTLYIQGIVPFSALAANAISNDGDALFPAIAMAPKAALIATIYSAVPALLLGYGLFLFGL